MREILRRFLPAAPDPPKPLPVVTELDLLVPYALGIKRRLEKLQTLARWVASQQIAGDVVECGVANGGSAAAIAAVFRSEPARRVWLYDSFEGMPPTTAKDGPAAAQAVGACKGTEERVREAFGIAKFPAERLTVRKGLFEQTFTQPLPDAIAFLHLDCDWYDSVMLALRTLYDRVADGGVIVLDDFGHWEGCREAFYDFAAERRIKPLLERFGHTVAFWIKGHAHNRAFADQWEIP